MQELIKAHKREYGKKPEIIISAPGVVNLMGEHTDYNEGYVLQAALPLRMRIAGSRRSDNSLRFFSANYGERKKTTIPNLKYKKEDRWANYSKGVLFELAKMGFSFKGIDITIQGDVPEEIGLGSSAAICVATAAVVKALFCHEITEMQIIQSAFQAEKTFLGNAVTLTDPLISCLSQPGKAMYLDLRTLDYSHVPLRFADSAFFITNSNVPKVSTAHELFEKIRECSECVEHLNKKKSGRTLRDYSISDLKNGMGIVPESIRRICLHVVEENERTKDAYAALKAKDSVSFGKLMNRSHESLRDRFEVSCPEIDWLVKRAGELGAVLGSRLTGPGFGGCTISLIRKDGLDDYKLRLDEYERIFGFTAEVFECVPGGGIKTEYPLDD